MSTDRSSRIDHRQFPTDATPPRHDRRGSAALFVAADRNVICGGSTLDSFCRIPGFSGTTQIATSAPTASSTGDRRAIFDANITTDLPSRFEPEWNTIEVNSTRS